MSRGAWRAGAGQGAAAAVQLLVTLSFLPSVVEAQVSPSNGGAGRQAEPPGSRERATAEAREGRPDPEVVSGQLKGQRAES